MLDRHVQFRVDLRDGVGLIYLLEDLSNRPMTYFAPSGSGAGGAYFKKCDSREQVALCDAPTACSRARETSGCSETSGFSELVELVDSAKAVQGLDSR